MLKYWSRALQGRTAEAERYFVRALSAAKAGFGERDPHVAAAANNLAELLRLQRRFADAAPLYEQVRLTTAITSLLSTSTTQRVRNLAGLTESRCKRRLQHTGQAVISILFHFGWTWIPWTSYPPLSRDSCMFRPDAVPKPRHNPALGPQSLAVLEAAYGAADVRLAAALHNVGGFYIAQREYAAARPYYERALKVRCLYYIPVSSTASISQHQQRLPSQGRDWMC
jgi:tetratricopeptide (TPR) repeat protein